jgi:Ca2+-dependent lipid-binding protein
LDPYIIVRTGVATSPEHCRTKHFENNMNPKFDETLFVLLNNVNTRLFLEVVDRNTNRTDTSIGIANFELSTLQESENIVEGL